jgi:hypothetical protein
MSNTGGPAYPTSNYGAIVPISTGYSEGMTLRQYAAIKLKVPDSGTDWLDDMILKSNEIDLMILTCKQQSSTL